MLRLHRSWIYLIASLLWLVAGANVLSIGIRAWLCLDDGGYAQYFWLIGSLIFFGIFIFPRTARRNVIYLQEQPKHYLPLYRCFRSSTWAVMIFMILLGILLRSTGWLSEAFIAGFYSGLGSSLMLAARYYYQPLRISLHQRK